MQRTELETWELIDECFDTFFLTERINCICDLVIYMAFPKIDIITYAERDVILERLERQRRKKGIEKFKPIWAFGEVEPRKEFITEIIKLLKNEHRAT